MTDFDAWWEREQVRPHASAFGPCLDCDPEDPESGRRCAELAWQAGAASVSAALAELEAEVRRALRLSRSHRTRGEYIVQYGSGLKPFEFPRIAALLHDQERTRQERHVPPPTPRLPGT